MRCRRRKQRKKHSKSALLRGLLPRPSPMLPALCFPIHMGFRPATLSRRAELFHPYLLPDISSSHFLVLHSHLLRDMPSSHFPVLHVSLLPGIPSNHFFVLPPHLLPAMPSGHRPLMQDRVTIALLASGVAQAAEPSPPNEWMCGSGLCRKARVGNLS